MASLINPEFIAAVIAEMNAREPHKGWKATLIERDGGWIDGDYYFTNADGEKIHVSPEYVRGDYPPEVARVSGSIKWDLWRAHARYGAKEPTAKISLKKAPAVFAREVMRRVVAEHRQQWEAIQAAASHRQQMEDREHRMKQEFLTRAGYVDANELPVSPGREVTFDAGFRKYARASLNVNPVNETYDVRLTDLTREEAHALAALLKTFRK